MIWHSAKKAGWAYKPAIQHMPVIVETTLFQSLAPLDLRNWRYINLSIIIIFFSAQGISDTEGEEKKWLENVNTGMTQVVCRLNNCCGAR